MAEIYEYSGYLTFTPLSDADLAQARSLMQQSGFAVDLGTTWAEVTYAGRDTGRKVLAFLSHLAGVLGQAEGEIVCEIGQEAGDPLFEFYTIKAQTLYVQQGAIVRKPVKPQVWPRTPVTP